MGCVIYFVLSDGKHPFGDNAHTNIIQYQCEMIDIDQEDWPAAKDLIMSMIDCDKSSRYVYYNIADYFSGIFNFMA